MTPGQAGRVAGIAPGALRARLLALGVTPGAQVRVVRAAPLGDPIEVEVRGARLSLRRAEAGAVEVEVDAHE